MSFLQHSNMSLAAAGAANAAHPNSITHILWLLRDFDEDDDYVLASWASPQAQPRDATALKGVFHASADVLHTLTSRPALCVSFSWGDDDSVATAFFAVAADSLLIVVMEGSPLPATGIAAVTDVLEALTATLGGLTSLRDRWCEANGTPRRELLQSLLAPVWGHVHAGGYGSVERMLEGGEQVEWGGLDAVAASLAHSVEMTYHGAQRTRTDVSGCTYNASPGVTGVGRAVASAACAARAASGAHVIDVPPPYAPVQACATASACTYSLVHEGSSLRDGTGAHDVVVASSLASAIARGQVEWTHPCLPYVTLYAASRGGVNRECNDAALGCIRGDCGHADAGRALALVFLSCSHTTPECVHAVVLCLGVFGASKEDALARAAALAAGGNDRDRAVLGRLVLHASSLLMPSMGALLDAVAPARGSK